MKSVSRISLARLLTGSFAVALLATPARGDVIMDWNAKADAIAIEKQIPNAPNARGQAMLHVAMFEAVNAIDRRYAPYKLNLVADRGTSREAAAATAAHDVLVALYPDRSPTSMRCLRRRWPELPSPTRNRRAWNSAGRPPPGSSRCAPMTAATRLRAIVLPPPRAPMCRPPRPIESTSFKMTPWAMSTASQFRPAPPPALNSEVWTRDLNEIREVGSNTSTRRTAEQTTTARFWFFTGPRTYNPIVRQVALARKMDIEDCARLYALSSIAGVDAFIAVFDGKYTYNLWRPMTAIRNAAFPPRSGRTWEGRSVN